MNGGTQFYIAAAIVAGLAIFLYWRVVERDYQSAVPPRPALITIGLVMLGFALCIWSVVLDRPDYSFTPQKNPIAIAIAFDLSPSMLAVPDPVFDRRVPARHTRARAMLLELFETLEERRGNVLVSLVGFTREAEILMGWDNSTTQIRDLLEHGLSPDLFTTSGTNIESAVTTLSGVFDMLPDDLQDTSRKIAILVSDGEDTTPRSFFGYALEEVAAGSFDVVALQTGLLDTSEGIPRYGQVGEFLGFQVVGGKTHTLPNVDAMIALSNATTQRGLYVRAEDPAAVEQTLQFTAHEGIDVGNLTGRLAAALGLFAVVALLCARVLQ